MRHLPIQKRLIAAQGVVLNKATFILLGALMITSALPASAQQRIMFSSDATPVHSRI